MKQLYENLCACAKEEEVKDEFCKFFNYSKYYMLNVTVPIEAYDSAAEANAMVEDGSVTNDPVFSIVGTQLNNRNATQDDIWLSLAKHVPAVSSPVGGMAVFQMSARNINMEVDGEQGVLRPNGWGRNHDVYQESWLHSDMKDMAFLYVYKLYEQLIMRGNLQ